VSNLERVEADTFRLGILQDWASAHLQRGQPEDIERAKELLSGAQAEFKEMGSPGYAKRIQSRLDELGS
jgi:hypothetical protein